METDDILTQGSLTVVAGSVGTGKSSFLKAILGQLHLVSGTAHAGGAYAYVPQVLSRLCRCFLF
jgi:ABC-type Mn2+/Zn2+ transport system ATPase subunit